MLAELSKAEMKKKGINSIRKVDGNEALKFLKGGA